MNISIELYNITKKINSTYVVEGDGVPVSLIWQQPYDVVNPSFLVRSEQDIYNYNYAYISEFGRYYWLDGTEIYRDRNQVILHCSCDVLATYKSTILTTTAYIERSESEYSTILNDSVLPAYATRQVAVSSAALPAITNNPFSNFVMEVIGTGASGKFTNTYFLTLDQLGAIAEKALDDDNIIADTFIRLGDMLSNSEAGGGWKAGVLSALLTDEEAANSAGALLGNIIDSVLEDFKNPWKCIVGLKGLAVDNVRHFSQSQAEVIFGNVASGVAGRRLSNTLSEQLSVTVAIPWIYNDFRNLSPYTNVNVTLPNCSVITIPSDLIYGQSSLTFKYRISASSGDVTGYIDAGSKRICDVSFNISSSMATGTRSGGVSDKTILGTAAGAIGTIGSLALGVNPKSSVDMLGNSINNMLTQTVSCRGLTKECCLYDNNMRVEVSSYNTPNPNSLLSFGRLLKDTRQLSSLSGYTVCSNAHVSVNATKAEIQQIDDYLNGGFYIE